MHNQEFPSTNTQDHKPTNSELKIINPIQLWNSVKNEVLKKQNPKIMVIGTDKNATLIQKILQESENSEIIVIEGSQEVIEEAKGKLINDDITKVTFIHGMFPDRISSEDQLKLKQDSEDLILGSYLIRYVKTISEKLHFIDSAKKLLNNESMMALSSFPVENLIHGLEFMLVGLKFQIKLLPFGNVFIFRKK